MVPPPELPRSADCQRVQPPRWTGAQSRTDRRALAHVGPVVRSSGSGRCSVEDVVEVGVMHETPVSSVLEIRAAVREVAIGGCKRQQIQGTTADMHWNASWTFSSGTSRHLQGGDDSTLPPEVIESLERDLVGPTQWDSGAEFTLTRASGLTCTEHGVGDTDGDSQVPGEVPSSRNSEPLRVSSNPAERRVWMEGVQVLLVLTRTV